jgi:hypothetical protein
MINLSKSVDQKKKEVQELNPNLYSLGWFDGLIGLEPTQIEDSSYWYGYSLGQREYWANKRGLKLPIAV